MRDCKAVFKCLFQPSWERPVTRKLCLGNRQAITVNKYAKWYHCDCSESDSPVQIFLGNKLLLFPFLCENQVCTSSWVESEDISVRLSIFVEISAMHRYPHYILCFKHLSKGRLFDCIDPHHFSVIIIVICCKSPSVHEFDLRDTNISLGPITVNASAMCENKKSSLANNLCRSLQWNKLLNLYKEASTVNKITSCFFCVASLVSTGRIVKHITS